MKKRKINRKRVLILSLVVILIIGIPTGAWLLYKRAHTSKDEFLPIDSVGTPPDALSKNVLKNKLITDAVNTGDGYLKADTSKKPAIVKYDEDGKKQWSKTYDSDADSFAIKNIAVTSDGGFAFTVNPETEQKDGSPAVYKCDGDGNLQWTYTLEGAGDAAAEHLFATGQGEFITAGHTSAEDITLIKLDADGQKTAGQTYGGSGADTLANAAFADGTGLAALIATQSKDGTFGASRDGSTVYVVALLDEDLHIVWQDALSSPAKTDDNFAMNGEGIYAVSMDNMLTKIGLDGAVAYQMKMKDDPLSLTKEQAAGRIVAWNESALYFFDGSGFLFSLPFDAGNVIQTSWESGNLLVVSQKDGKDYYTGYDTDGNLLWRVSYPDK